MKKKAYMAPATEFIAADLEQLIANSVTQVQGDVIIPKAEEGETVPTTADSRFNSIWDDED